MPLTQTFVPSRPSTNHRIAVGLPMALALAGCFEPSKDVDPDGQDTEAGSGSGDVQTGEDETSATSQGPDEGSDPTGNVDATGQDSGSEDTVGDSTGSSCGDGVVDRGEECDEGEATATCSADCIACAPETDATVNQQLGVCVVGPYSECGNGWSMVNGQSGLQAFVPDVDGTLTLVELNVLNEAVDTSVMTLHLVDGGTNGLLPVGASVAELEAAIVATSTAAGTTDYTWVEFDFGDRPVALEADRNYYLWLRLLEPFPADPQLRIRWNLWLAPEVPDPYDRGRSFFCPAGEECDTQLQHWDFAFRTYIAPAPPVCEP